MKLRRLISLGISMVLMLSLLSCGGPEEKKMKFFNKGKSLYEKGDYVKAGLEFKNALQIDPKFSQAYYMMGMVELKKGIPQKAYGLFVKAADLDPKYWDAHIQVGKLFFGAQMNDKALEKAELVLKENPGNEEALLLKSGVALRGKNPDEALGVLQKLLDQKSIRPELYGELATAYEQKNDPAKAEEWLRKGVETNPKSVILLTVLAEFYTRHGKIQDAEGCLQKIIALEPKFETYKAALANLYWETNQKDKGTELLKGIISDDPQKEYNWLLVSKFYIFKKMFTEAEQELEAGIKQNQKSFKLRLALSELYVNTNKAADAIATLNACLGLDKDSANPEIIQTKNALAKIYLMKGQRDEAEKFINEVLKESPRNVDANFMLGTLNLRDNQGEKAVAAFRTIVNDKPEFMAGYVNLAQAHLLNQETDLAAEVLKNGLKVNPNSREVLRMLARVLVIKKEYRDAETQLRKILDAQPKDGEARADLGDVFASAGNLTQAEQEYLTISEQYPKYFLGPLKLSVLYQMEGKWKPAIAAAEKAYQLNPNAPAILQSLIGLYLRQEKYPEALATCTIRINQNPKDAFSYFLLGQIYGAKKNYPEAEEALQKAIAIQPQWPDPYNAIAQLYLAQGKSDVAIEKLRAALKANPKNPSAYLLLGQIFEGKKDLPNAIAVYHQGVASIPKFWAAENNLAFLLAEQSSQKSDLEKALLLAQNALKERPGDPSITDTIGWIHFKMGDTKQALGFMQTALAKGADNSTINYHMGVMLAKTGKTSEAKQYLQKALASNQAFYGKDDATQLLRSLP